MILGIGVDLTELSRIEKACKTRAFSIRIYTEAEREQAQGRVSFFAGRFAAKEAVAKALGTGFSGVFPQEIETLSDEHGRPCVTLYGGAAKRAEELGVRRVHLSITHAGGVAVATAVLEGGEP